MTDTKFLNEYPATALFADYEPAIDTTRAEEVLGKIDSMVFWAHGPDYAAGAAKMLSQPLVDYARLLDDVSRHPRLRWVTAYEQLRQLPVPGTIACHMRHDVDIDLRAGLELARLESARGIRSTFYVLHTAPYYGHFEGGRFHRHEAMRDVYREIADLGHEIALHTDPYHLYLEHGIDGAQAVAREIEWLRQGGIEIRGSAAHNSWPSYGAENFAIFKGRRVRFDMPTGPLAFERGGNIMPLQVLDEKALGLEYEGNDLFFLRRGLVEYACLLQHNRWMLQTNARACYTKEDVEPDCEIFSGWITQDRLVEHISGLEQDYDLCLSVHPVYYGLRQHASTGPTQGFSDIRTVKGGRLGWTRLASEGVHGACANESDNLLEYQAVYMADEFGFTNRPPIHGARGTADIRILMLGSTNTAGPTQCVPAQVQCLLEDALREQTGKSIEVVKAAHTGAGLARSVDWFETLKDVVKPHVVVLGFSSDEIALSDPDYWHPSAGDGGGRYLRGTQQISATVVEWLPAQAAKRVQRSVAPTKPVSLCEADAGLDPVAFNRALNTVQAVLEAYAAAIEAAGAKPLLLVEQCGEELGLWRETANKSQRIQAHQNLSMYFKALNSRAKIPVVDPYPRMIDLAERYATHRRDGIHWNERGNRITAETLLSALHRLDREAFKAS